MRDLHSNISIDDTISTVSFTNGGAPTGTADLTGCDSAELLINIGTPASPLSGSNYMIFTVTHSDNDSDYTNVAAADMLGVTPASGVILTVDADAEADMSYNYGYVGGKRYLKILGGETGTLPATPITVTTIKSHLMDAPPIS